MANATTQITTPTPTTTKGIVDMLLAQRMLNIVSNISTSDSSSFISLKQVGGLLALLSLEEFRTIISDAISYFREFIKGSTILTTIKNTIIFVIVKIKQLIFKTPANDVIVCIENVNNKINPIMNEYLIELDDKLLIAIINYGITKGILKYNINNKKVKYDTSGIKTGVKTEQWNGFHFEHDSINYLFNKTLIITKNSLTNTITKIGDFAVSFETDEYRLISENGFIAMQNRMTSRTRTSSYYIRLYTITDKKRQALDDFNIKITTCNETVINGYGTSSTNKYNIHQSMLGYLAYICKLYEQTTGKIVTQRIFNTLTGSNSHTLVSYEFTHDINDVHSDGCKDYLASYNFMIQMAELGYFVEWKKPLIFENDRIVPGILQKTEDFIPDYKFKDNNDNLNISQQLKHELTAFSNTKTIDEIASSFDKLLKVVCSDATKFEKDKYVPQKTYFLSISRKTKVNQVPNPEYDTWLEMKNALLPPTPDKPAKDTDTTIPLPPPKTLSTETKIVEVLCKELGTCFKPLDTLYITEQDMIALTSSIEMFRDQKNMLKDLGLPNKYGLFLSGPPGTGKTSTIYAVATYLQKPIYYVGLNDVHTNHELSMLVEHIYEKSVAGGIIVFEDIDAMTNIVLSREITDLSGSSVVDVMKDVDKELTLSYFLNLLDGVMSRDGMITIASSNHPEKLDAAFLRDGRFDIHIHLGYANKFQISKIFKMFFKRTLSNEILECVQEGRYTPANFIFRFKIFVLRPETTDAIIMEPFLK